MSKIVTRQPNTDEIPALHHIWTNTFGAIGLESFFRHIFDPEMCLIALVKKTPVAMGYLIPNGNIVSLNGSAKCSMIYSVATLPGYRGKGLGTAIVNDLISLSREIGYPAVVLCPSNDELFDYYSQRSELHDWFYVNEQVVNVVPESLNTSQLVNVPADKYNTLRESLLSGINHIEHDQRILEYQELLCTELGGGLFQIDDSCAIIERQTAKTVWIKELLTPDFDIIDVTTDANTVDLLASIAEKFPAKEYIIRFPSQSVMWRRFGMLAIPEYLPDGLTETGFAPWYGMAFD